MHCSGTPRCKFRFSRVQDLGPKPYKQLTCTPITSSSAPLPDMASRRRLRVLPFVRFIQVPRTVGFRGPSRGFSVATAADKHGMDIT